MPKHVYGRSARPRPAPLPRRLPCDCGCGQDLGPRQLQRHRSARSVANDDHGAGGDDGVAMIDGEGEGGRVPSAFPE